MTHTQLLRNIGILAGPAICLSPVFAAPLPLAGQDDIAKMWKIGGISVETKVPVTGQPFKSAVAFTVPKKTAHPWNAQAGMNPKSALRQGDTFLATFFIRSAKPSSGGRVTFGVEGGPKYESSASKKVDLTSTWRKVSVPFVSKGAYAAGKWQISFQMGAAAQTVQIADFRLLKR